MASLFALLLFLCACGEKKNGDIALDNQRLQKSLAENTQVPVKVVTAVSDDTALLPHGSGKKKDIDFSHKTPTRRHGKAAASIVSHSPKKSLNKSELKAFQSSLQVAFDHLVAADIDRKEKRSIALKTKALFADRRSKCVTGYFRGKRSDRAISGPSYVDRLRLLSGLHVEIKDLQVNKEGRIVGMSVVESN